MAQSSRGSLSTVIMIVAFLGIGGFMYWLYIASEPTEFAVAEEGEQTRLVSLSEYAQNPAAHQDGRIELDGVEVQEPMGTHLFFFEVPGYGAYLARVDRELVEDGLILLPGDRGRVVGSVRSITEATIDGWEAEGLFAPGSGHRERAATMASYLHVEEVELTASAEMEVEPAPEAPAGTNEE